MRFLFRKQRPSTPCSRTPSLAKSAEGSALALAMLKTPQDTGAADTSGRTSTSDANLTSDADSKGSCAEEAFRRCRSPRPIPPPLIRDCEVHVDELHPHEDDRGSIPLPHEDGGFLHSPRPIRRMTIEDFETDGGSMQFTHQFLFAVCKQELADSSGGSSHSWDKRVAESLTSAGLSDSLQRAWIEAFRHDPLQRAWADGLVM